MPITPIQGREKRDSSCRSGQKEKKNLRAMRQGIQVNALVVRNSFAIVPGAVEETSKGQVVRAIGGIMPKTHPEPKVDTTHQYLAEQ